MKFNDMSVEDTLHTLVVTFAHFSKSI